jgi:ElaB/YqjD/DUF883 family membrane-anchored ribosome-binding protein
MEENMSPSSTRRSADDDSISTDDVIEDLRAVVRDAEALLRATEDQVGERVEEVRKHVEETLVGARTRLEDAVGDKGARVREAARSTEAYVKENPWTALIIAAGAGFLIGAIGRIGRDR